eukprot:8748813-Pyramimonas_sp.AAC.1
MVPSLPISPTCLYQNGLIAGSDIKLVVLVATGWQTRPGWDSFEQWGAPPNPSNTSSDSEGEAPPPPREEAPLSWGLAK